MSNHTPFSVASDQSRRSHVGSWPDPMGRATGNWPDPCVHTSAAGPTHNAQGSQPSGFMIQTG
jgi:hypothetical protein